MARPKPSACRYNRQGFTIDQVVEVPDFSDLIRKPKHAVTDGNLKPKDVNGVLLAYETALSDTVLAIREGNVPTSFFVPDLYQITKGRSPVFFSEKDSDRVYESWVLGHCIGAEYFRVDYSAQNAEFPGTVYVPR